MCMSLMIPNFFTAGHHNYARYGMYHHRSSEAMPNETSRPSLQGEHVTRHIAGVWKGMWTDMMSGGRTNFMQCGKGPRGLIGITLKPNKRKSPGSCGQGSYFDHQEGSIIMCCFLGIRRITSKPYLDVTRWPGVWA